MTADAHKQMSGTDRARRFLGKKYLDLAARIPSRSHGLISYLQGLRREQNDASEKTFQRSRPPEGAELHFLGFRLVEVFAVEDLNTLFQGLEALFPVRKPTDRSVVHRLERFRSAAGRLFGRRRTSVGYIDREQRHGVSGPYRTMPSLPEEVESVKVEVYTLFPSVITVSFWVKLERIAAERLTQVQTQSLLPAVWFEKWIPRGRVAGGSARESCDLTLQRAVLSWLEGVRTSTEDCLRPFIRGYFNRDSRRSGPVFPAVEAFALVGTPEDTGAFCTQWVEASRGWLDSLGFDYVLPRWYKSQELLFQVEDSAHCGLRVPHRLVALPEHADKEHWQNFKNDPHGLFSSDINHRLETFEPFVVVLSRLSSLQEEVERLRAEALVQPAGNPRRNLRRGVQLAHSIRQHVASLEGLLLEYEASKTQLLKDVSDLALTSAWDQRSSIEFHTALERHIESTSQAISNHAELVDSNLSKSLTVRSIEASHRLQFAIVVLAISNLVLAAFANWDRVAQMVGRLWSSE